MSSGNRLYGICGRQFETLKGWHISRTRKEDGRYSSLDEAAAACPSSPSSSSGKDIGVTGGEWQVIRGWLNAFYRKTVGQNKRTKDLMEVRWYY
ncbi:Uncharacterized protein BM_BM17337 [Brugia malayi]|uniref:Uncharacterized protein n=1 Tax=Brugia malayi TaxID=6279 RepID=A0A4E9F3K5_BRUMA|nr:Uncharacterized protein BM_BM17337 [Brugia malayi]VIO90400.1 Uncharacterized protein BM_BM17337 [Brugia malayi]